MSGLTLFGTKNGHFFGYVPDFVDVKRAPGASVQPAATFREVCRKVAVARAPHHAGGAAARSPISPPTVMQSAPR